MIKAAEDYVGQIVHYNGHNYTITEGPEYEYAAAAVTVNERRQAALLLLKLDESGDIVRAATRHGPWKDVTITQPDAATTTLDETGLPELHADTLRCTLLTHASTGSSKITPHDAPPAPDAGLDAAATFA
ncbi:hypothetical protein ACQP2U_42485 (plasmid) [Nocardia sp. CA-084685]|uniref:hypothetical protein n=1 Tax=Nocardia sp. CA-084685 TaxID=3239970 RepID=UPI003D98CC24